jgi:hypothetical protein
LAVILDVLQISNNQHQRTSYLSTSFKKIINKNNKNNNNNGKKKNLKLAKAYHSGRP